MKRNLILALALILLPICVYAVDLGADFPEKGFARGDALNAKFDALNDGKIDATGTSNITGSIGVTGKATVGTLESGAVSLTGNVTFNQSWPQINSVGSSYMVYTGKSMTYLGANSYHNGTTWLKHVDSSPSVLMQLYDNEASVKLYISEGGNASPTQLGPYSVWHGGMNSFVIKSQDTAFTVDSSDGADARSLSFSPAGATANTRGSYIKLYGNESVGSGSLVLVGGAKSDGGEIAMYTGSGVNRFTLRYDGTASFSENVYFAKDVSALTFTDRSDSPETLEDAKAIVMSHETIPGESRIDHSKLSPLAFGKKEYQVPTGRTIEVPPSLEAVQEYQSKLAAFEQAEAGVPPEGEPMGKSMAAPLEEPEAPKPELVPEMQTVVEPDQSKRNLSMVVSAQALVIKDLLKRMDALEARVTALEAK